MKSKLVLIAKNFEEIICSLLISVMSSLVICNVLLRFATNYSISWSEEVATICFVWTVFLGASAVYKNKLDMGIDALLKLSSISVQDFLRDLVRLMLLFINGYIFYISMIFTKMTYLKPTAVLGVSSAVVSSALVVSFGLMTLHSLRFIFESLSGSDSKTF